MKSVKLPVELGYTASEVLELYPGLSEKQISEILNASYAIEATYSFEAHRFIGIKTSVYYKK